MANEFEGQRAGERVLFVFRRHILVSRKGMYLLTLSVFVGMWFPVIWPLNSDMWWVFVGFVALGMLMYMYAYMLWYFSVNVVTSERLRVINQEGMFKRKMVDLPLDRVESVEMSVPGLFGGMFHYGTILIHTVAGDMSISNVSRPEVVYNKLQDALDKVKKG